MSKLENWFPFKFKRKTDEEASSEPARTSAGPLVPFLGGEPMSRMMQSFFGEGNTWPSLFGTGEPDRWFGDFSPKRFRPSVDVVDEESHLRVTAELPGMDKDDIKLSFEEQALTIRGEKRREEESRENGCYRTERSYGMFSRTLPLPRDVDPEAAEATFDNGVLSVRLPKIAERAAKSRLIEIRDR